MIFITGDTHGEFYRLGHLKQTDEDIIIILGDAGINYYLNNKDSKLKEFISSYKIKLFCIQGNHEERPENIKTYKEVEMFDGKVFIEEKYPYIIFAKNGECYELDGKKVLVIGGAYSVDKDYRLCNGYQWFKDEQLSDREKEMILKKYSGKHVDVILSHTCPLKYEPKETFLPFISQSKVDKSMENFLDIVEELIDYDKWYCGHYHVEKQIDKIEFMFGRIKDFQTGEFVPKYNHLNGYEIIRDFCTVEDVFKDDGVFCPKCKSKNIVIQKGDGEIIDGFDAIAVICHECKKVYGFKDVLYKSHCPREL
mgnify:CR=1 FL=1